MTAARALRSPVGDVLSTYWAGSGARAVFGYPADDSYDEATGYEKQAERRGDQEKQEGGYDAEEDVGAAHRTPRTSAPQ